MRASSKAKPKPRVAKAPASESLAAAAKPAVQPSAPAPSAASGPWSAGKGRTSASGASRSVASAAPSLPDAPAPEAPAFLAGMEPSSGDGAKQVHRRSTVNARARAAQMRSSREGALKDDANGVSEGEDAKESTAPSKRPRLLAGKVSKKAKIIIAVVLALAIAVGATVAYCVWDIWYRYDDAADIQGNWISQDGAALVIDESQMQLTDTVSYAYTIDTQAKTITFTYANAQGSAAYHFNADRSQLVIEDGGTTDWLVILGVVADPALTETPDAGTTVLTRVS